MYFSFCCDYGIKGRINRKNSEWPYSRIKETIKININPNPVLENEDSIYMEKQGKSKIFNLVGLCGLEHVCEQKDFSIALMTASNLKEERPGDEH